MSVMYFQPATDFPYDCRQIASSGFSKLACNFWVTLSKDRHLIFNLETQSPGLYLLCLISLQSRLQLSVFASCPPQPHSQVQAACWQPGQEVQPYCSGWLDLSKQICWVYSMFNEPDPPGSAESQGSELLHSISPTHRQAIASPALLVCGERPARW